MKRRTKNFSSTIIHHLHGEQDILHGTSTNPDWISFQRCTCKYLEEKLLDKSIRFQPLI